MGLLRDVDISTNFSIKDAVVKNKFDFFDYLSFDLKKLRFA